MTQTNLAYNTDTATDISVHKFGGSSLATAKCVRRVISILKQHCSFSDVVVVSANGKTTDALINIINLLTSDKDAAKIAINELVTAHEELIRGLVTGDAGEKLVDQLKADALTIFNDASEGISATLANDIQAYGELWSSRLLAAALTEHFAPAQYIDARDFLVIDNSIDANVQTEISATQLSSIIDNSQLTVVTGYIAKNAEGDTATLGRNGSDYSATIVADLIGAKHVTLWTDVDGIYSADPRLVPTARKLHRLPNSVAKELGSLGNPVLHVNTLKPLDSDTIHLHVRSSFDVENSATEIGDFGQIAQQELCVTSLNNLALCQLQAKTSVVVSERILKLKPIYFNDAEGSLVVTQAQLHELGLLAEQQGFSFVSKPVSLLAAVGFNIAQRSEIKALFLRSIRQVKPTSVVPSQSGHSLIALFDNEVSVELLNRTHSKLTQDIKNIGLVIAGLGNIGSRFLELLPAQLQRVPVLDNVHLVGLIGSRKAYIDNDGIEPTEAQALYNRRAVSYDESQLIEWLAHHPYDELVVVDVTPSEPFSALYHDFFKHGIHVIGANKWAASSSQENVNLLKDTAKKHGSYWYGNTTVGAGLPINYAIDDLIKSGDQINEISGIFSGTLSWLFQKFDGTQPFSQLVKEALNQGLTEPDPRDDLSGRDVQRKLLILARAAGFELSLEDINCVNLVPESLQNVSVDAFLDSVNALDDEFNTRLHIAQEAKECLRYVASFKVKADGGYSADVKLVSLPDSHPFANLTPCDNVFKINSQWYQDNALIIRGPGAGRDVTAGGLHSDLVTLCQQLTLQTKQAKIKGIN